ncbi:LamG domain-containing protein, partial [Gramella jeungdoensis]
ASGTIFPIGTTTITYTATDAASRTHSESFTITVTDNEDPTASNPPPVTVECIDEIPVNIAVVTDEADNCTINPIVTHVSDVSDGNTCPEIITRTYNISDGNGNSINVTQTITINDITKPSFTKPADITINKSTTCTYDASLSFTGDVTNEDDNCSTNLNATFSDSINVVSLGETIITRTWSLVDDCGNSADDQIQIITVLDNINPVAICQPITVAVDEVFTAVQINNGSTDNCGIEFYSLDRTSFNCEEVGDQTVTLTVTDYNGNVSTCEAIVTVLPTDINGGNVTGHNYFTNGDLDGPEGTLVNVTACPENEIKNAHLTITGNDGAINTWQYSFDGGATWNDVAGDPSSFSFTNVGKTEMDYMNILKTTLFRVKIDVGSCVGYSPTMLVQVIPPDIKPSIDFDTAYICIGDDITVNASSEYANNILLDEGGLFNQANPEGWRLNYVVGEDEIKFPASADNEDVSIWAETNGPKDFGSLTYDTSDNTKFAIAFGDFSGEKYGSTTWNETWTTMETPIFDSRGLEELYIVFDQAYYLEAGASIKIEISTDGGVTYPADINPLDPGYNSVTGAAHNYTGPSTSGTGTHNGGFVHTLIDLTDDYLGQSNLRVRFTFEGGGTTNSSWAIDNISVPDQHVDEVIEWTDEFGNIITYGFTATITPVSPGHQHIGATSLIDQCRSVDDIGTQRIEVFVDYAYAGTDLVSDVSGDGECGETSVILNAYDNEKSSNENKLDDAWDDSNGFTLSDIPGSVYSGMPGTFEGTWTAVPNLTCAASTLLDFSFSDIHDPKSTFTGEAGDYTLTWTTVRTLPDGSQKICTDDMNVTITNCAGVNFDGNNDYVDFKATNYNLTNQDFSIEAWIRPDINSTQIQTVFSKRNANNLGGLGYDLRLTDRIISFNWMNGGNISSPYQIDNDRWYHVGVTFDGGTYKLYIDGIEVASKSGQALLETDFDCMLGAMDDVNLSFPYGIAKNFFNGSMDEVRIWNVALTENQLRETMNQEINNDGSGGVIGAKVPILIDGLVWSDLEGYYRMDESCGFLTPTSGVINGKLRNIFDDQVQNAPIPYTSNTGVNGQNWNTDNTWTHFDVWDPPNSLGVDGTRIDWNIVEISNDINSAEAGGIEGITLLGLISNSGELTMAANGAMDETNSGRMLWITHYLKLNGSIDLVGESQLLQKKYGYYNDPPFNHNYITTQLSESILDEDSTGYIERDQQGQGNLYNYDFRSSPVDNFGTVSPFDEDSSTYTIKGVMFDGINVTASDEPKEITFNTLHDGNASTNPIQISTRWLYLNRSAASWTRICPTCAIKIGEGFTFKGSIDPLVSSDSQNFVFKGKPNNGTFNNLTIGTNWDSYLVGNPYPSAMDADQFIIDNGSIIQGAVYYYHDFGTDNTHLTTKASYGYAIYSLAGSVQAINRRPENGPNGGKLPARYIPVVQGFWVYGLNGGTLKFNNNQRTSEFVTKTSSGSVLFKAAKSKKSAQEG